VVFLFVSPRLKEKAYLVDEVLAKGLDIHDDKVTPIHPDNPIV
jgi:POT family proton-dependent oligopeptide transporter